MSSTMWEVLGEVETKESQLLQNTGVPSGKPVSALSCDLIVEIEANSDAAVAAVGKGQP